MKTIVLLTGECEARESFHNVTKEIFRCKVFEVEKMSKQDNSLAIGMTGNEIFYRGISEHIERIADGGELQLETIEGYSRGLSKMIQDDFPIFEIEVNETGILSKGNCCFVLNVLDENFAEQARELVSKLSI